MGCLACSQRLSQSSFNAIWRETSRRTKSDVGKPGDLTVARTGLPEAFAPCVQPPGPRRVELGEIGAGARQRIEHRLEGLTGREAGRCIVRDEVQEPGAQRTPFTLER